MSRTRDQAAGTAEDFLRRAADFRLGELPTERPHPATRGLSRMAREEPRRAIRVLRQVDLEAIASLRAALPDLALMQRQVRDTLEGGGRIFLGGCGATGRLALTLEFLWRGGRRAGLEERVVAFMAGGDAALVRSVENFEDHPEYGERQLQELGYREGDLLIACTEGGETPFVIGATEFAARLAGRPPFFLYCNPGATLQFLERSRRVLNHANVRPLELFVGPMSLSGSTRLQASTVQMLAVGLALLHFEAEDLSRLLVRFLELAAATDFSALEDFLREESRLYQEEARLFYSTDAFGITILTDTTERAPTFSLAPFEHQDEPSAMPSLCYLVLPQARDASAAWRALLRREPRALNWGGLEKIADPDRILGFDFSRNAYRLRRQRLPGRRHEEFSITRRAGGIRFRLCSLVHQFPAGGSELEEHLLLKLLLNMHSTLVMGRLGRYRSNIMTWVRPSNNKLIDRAIRYVDHLIGEEAPAGAARPGYEEIARQLFLETGRAGPDESVVLRTVQALIG